MLIGIWNHVTSMTEDASDSDEAMGHEEHRSILQTIKAMLGIGYKPPADRIVYSHQQGIVESHALMEPYGDIPRIIHQSWKTKELPPKFQQWRQTWIDKHEGWELKLWTDEDNLEMVKSDFEWFLPAYERLPSNIQRADAARLMYMHKYGGFYADLDVECLQSHEALRKLGTALLPLMDSRQYFHWHNIPNAWMASPPGHPFWMHMLHAIGRLTHSTSNLFSPEATTGPKMLLKTAKQYDASANSSAYLLYMAPGLIFPYSWIDWTFYKTCSTESKAFNAEACKQQVDPEQLAFAVTYWSHTWEGYDKSSQLGLD